MMGFAWALAGLVVILLGALATPKRGHGVRNRRDQFRERMRRLDD